MKVKFGYAETPRETLVEMDDSTDVDKFKDAVESALNNQKMRIFWLTDRNSRSYGIILDQLAYLEIDADSGKSNIGFGTA